MAQLNCDTAFTIPLFGGIPVAESVVVTWIIMAVLLIAAAILGRNLKVENVGKKQLVLETIVGGLYNFFYDLLGEEGKQYIPYLMTVGVYIGFANMIGLFGLKSPTKDVGVTGALALMSIILIEAAGVRKKGGSRVGASDPGRDAACERAAPGRVQRVYSLLQRRSDRQLQDRGDRVCEISAGFCQ